MTKTGIGITLLSGMFWATACSKEPQWADPELHAKKEEVQAKYNKLLVGDWHRIVRTDTRLFYSHYRLNEDGSMSSEEKFVKRDTVLISGEPTLTDWTTAWQDKRTGHWRISVARTEDFKGFYTYLALNSEIFLFYDIAGDTLKVSGYPGYLLRGDVKPDF